MSNQSLQWNPHATDSYYAHILDIEEEMSEELAMIAGLLRSVNMPEDVAQPIIDEARKEFTELADKIEIARLTGSAFSHDSQFWVGVTIRYHTEISPEDRTEEHLADFFAAFFQDNTNYRDCVRLNAHMNINSAAEVARAEVEEAHEHTYHATACNAA